MENKEQKPNGNKNRFYGQMFVPCVAFEFKVPPQATIKRQKGVSPLKSNFSLPLINRVRGNEKKMM
jgi:hypothetical protein